VDQWEPFKTSIQEWAPHAAILSDKFHILQRANKAIDEVRRAEFFRQGGAQREVVKGKRQQLNPLFALNRKVIKACLLKGSLGRLWTCTYEGAAENYLNRWLRQLLWQRLPAFEKLANMLVTHLGGILNYCRVKVRFGVVEAINGNIKSRARRGRGYKTLRYLLLKAQRMAVTKTEFVAFREAA
jgi:transposase